VCTFYLLKAWARRSKTNMHLIVHHKWRYNLLEHAKHDKENLPPNCALTINQIIPIKKNQTKSIIMIGKWTDEELEEAMDVVERGCIH
jgi:hypothetical protein